MATPAFVAITRTDKNPRTQQSVISLTERNDEVLDVRVYDQYGQRLRENYTFRRLES